MIRSDHPLLRCGEALFARPPLRFLKGILSAYVAYPLAEKHEKRQIRPKLQELRQHYLLSFKERVERAKQSLFETLRFAQAEVPYYRDLFKQLSFEPEKVLRDPRYLEVLPYLDKKIIAEQGERLLSASLSNVRHHVRKTGGSTGQSAVIYYDQESLDYSAAVILYTREKIGKKKSHSELHFACQFPGETLPLWPSSEDFKCFAMNRSNIFFGALDDQGLEAMWKTLCRRKPFLAHGHPSTLYALACYVECKYGSGKAFQIFESSGELLQPYMREKIARVLRCRVIDRYGLAEFGVVAYEWGREELQVLDSEVWPESRPTEEGGNELVLTGFRNRLMPLIRYATGDRAKVIESSEGFYLREVLGRIHDLVPIKGIPYPTHHIMDILDHRVGGIEEFQIDLRSEPPTMRIIPLPGVNPEAIRLKVEGYWPGAFKIEFVGHNDFVRVGHRAKFRHVVNP